MSDIATLFARDPLQMSDEDFSLIVQKFRENRSSFNSAPAIATKKPSTPKVTAEKKAILDLDIGDIDV